MLSDLFPSTLSIFSLFCILLFGNCASIKTENIQFIEESFTSGNSTPKLDIYQSKKTTHNPVLIFVHGGYWDEGDKDIYGFLGRNLARKDVVTVIPNYTLSPHGNYDTMAEEVSAAIDWAAKNISQYNGDPNQIFLMGHSAGGHLIALATTNTKYIDEIEQVKGVILNDSAGLDMYSYLQEYPPTPSFHHYTDTWTDDESKWKDASPLYFISEKTPPYLIYVGTKTYPSIIDSNKDFLKALKTYQPKSEINFLNKKHVPMMRQFVYPWNPHYKTILAFIENPK